MSDPDKSGFRLKNGQFGRKRIAQWKENVSIANKKRCLKKEYLMGRRIVDIGTLATELWCSACDIPLSLREIVSESILGLGSTFGVRCSKCLTVCPVRSSNYDKQKSNHRFHVNLKAAIAILDGGIGEMQLNTILSALNIPTLTHKLLKRHERIVGPVIEETAKDSCLEALRIEKNLTIANERVLHEKNDPEVPPFLSAPYFINLDSLGEQSSTTEITEELSNVTINSEPSIPACTTHSSDPETSLVDVLQKEHEPVGITASYDAGWQKKGSGRSYNSRTGHGTAFGRFSRKCIAFTTRNKSCRLCATGVEKSKHDCRMNFSGSSKAMEPDMAVEIFTRNEHFANENVFLKTLIGDEDSSTMASLRRQSNQIIEKWTDKNHATKKLVKYLYAATKLPTPVVEYFRKCFGCVLEINKGNVDATRTDLLNIVPHSFGEHEKCGSWCAYKTDPENFKHKYFPGGKPLAGDDLRLTLLKIFQQFADNAEKLCPCGSSQINENANMGISHKAPKAIHYGSSSSNDFRVSAAICQINMGTVYIDTVNKRLKLSPLKNKSLRYRIGRDKERQQKSDRIKSAHFKKRRRALFRDRQAKTVRAENKEGISYQSNCGFEIGINFVDKPLVHVPLDAHTTVVYFDIETTGFKKTDEIVQIAAKIDEKDYSAYIMPSCKFSHSASVVTGLEVRDGVMCLDSIPVATVSASIAITGFITFLRSVSSSVVLAAHNGTRFDAPMIMRLIQQLGLVEEFAHIVYGFADTLTLLKSKLTERKAAKKSFSQGALASDYLGTIAIEGAHNAIVDVHVLQQLLRHEEINVSANDLIKNAITVQAVINNEAETAKHKANVKSLEILKAPKDGHAGKSTIGISAGTIGKIAKAGIRLEDLQQTYSNSGIEGITILLSQNVGEKGARVTTCRRIITALTNKLEALRKTS